MHKPVLTKERHTATEAGVETTVRELQSHAHCRCKKDNILSQPQRKHNTAQPQQFSWVGHENDCAYHPTHHRSND